MDHEGLRLAEPLEAGNAGLEVLLWVEAGIGGVEDQGRGRDATDLWRRNGHGSTGGPAIDLSGADGFMDGVTVADCLFPALRLNTDSFPTVQNCTFVRCRPVPVDRVPIASIPGFTNNTAQGTLQGEYMEIGRPGGLEAVHANLVFGPANALNQDGVFAPVTNIVVDPGAGLGLLPGTVFKWKLDGTGSRGITCPAA